MELCRIREFGLRGAPEMGPRHPMMGSVTVLGYVTECLQAQEKDAKPPQCCLCPVTGGALKPSTDKGLWAHAACMQWIPEVSVEDVTRMEPVSHIKSIQKERWDLLCVICKCAAAPCSPVFFRSLDLLVDPYPKKGACLPPQVHPGALGTHLQVCSPLLPCIS